jgi:outer membrane protein assembly factor BamD (BamD/ComL family)
MKKFLSLFSIAALLVTIITGCKKDSPKEIATAWLTSFYHMDYDGAKKYSTEDTKNMLALFEEFNKAAGGDSLKTAARKITVKVKDVKQEGDKATAFYTVSDHPDKQEAVYLVKQNDHWLVQFSKRDQQMSKSADDAKAAETSGADTTSASPADTSR